MMNTQYSPYAPVRLRNEFWWRYAGEAARAGAVNAQGMIAPTLADRILRDIVAPGLRAVTISAKGEPDAGHIVGQTAARLTSLRQWVPLIAQYELCGRQIFDLADELVEMLANTDIGECTLGDWHPPYDAFFVRFGKRDEIRLPFGDNFEYLDGAFVAVTPLSPDGAQRRVKIGFSTVHPDGGGVMMPGLFFDLMEDELEQPVRDAVESAFKRKLAEFNHMPSASSSENAVNAHRRDLLTESADILREATNLLVNSLFYIESINSAREASPGRDVPPDMCVRWAQSPKEKRQKLRSSMTRDGYSVVYLVGQEFSASRATTTQVARRPHWRRGHWRMQPYGQGLAQTRRIWIKPVMIGKDVESAELPGHVYVTGGPPGSSPH